MTPRLIAFYEGDEYARMARVLAHTAALHCPGWDVRIEDVTLFPNGEKTADERVRGNSEKLRRWVAEVDQAPDGTPIALIDADVMILRPFGDLWERPFDVAYTVRDPKRTPLPLNAGIVYVRATEPARRFLHAWFDATQPIRQSTKLFAIARKQFGAADQAGLAGILKNPAITQGVHLLPLPCLEWNCEDSEWGRFDPSTTRLVHIKGGLRNLIFGQPVSPKRKIQVTPLVRLWKDFDQAARAHTAFSLLHGPEAVLTESQARGLA